MRERKSFSATDAAPVVLHGKENAESELVYPVLVNTAGSLKIEIASSEVAIGGGAQYDTDDPSAGDDTGTLALAIRKDTAVALADTDGDFTPLQVDPDGFLRTTITGSSGGVQIENAIDETAYDLNAAAFSEASSQVNDYILDSIKLNFSTTESKTITVTGPDGTILYQDTNINQNISITEIDIGFNGGENFTVDVTQFSSPGTMDCVAVVRSASSALVGTPDVKIQGYNGTNYWPVRIDTITRSLQTVDYAHHEIHAGSHFFVQNFAAIADGSDLDFIWSIPDITKWPHALWAIESDVELEFYLYESPTVTTGTLVPVYNNNRNSATTNSTLAYTATTVVSTGSTLVYSAKVGQGKKIGGEGSRNHEFIGKQNTEYLFRISNNSGGAGWVSYDFNWYEHTDKAA